MAASATQERIEEFLRKSLLGEELVNTQFHLFSARSLSSGRVVKPRVLCANNVLLAKSSKYFLDLLSSDVNPSDPSLFDLTDDNDVPNNGRINEYGYGSDSDLDDCNDPVAETPKNQSTTSPISTRKPDSKTQSKDDDESSDDESVSSDMFVMSPEQPRTDGPFSLTGDRTGSVAGSETAVHGVRDNKTLPNYAAMRLRSLGSRHVLVKDTAFQTWYTLLDYLYTDKVSFLPLGSATPGGRPQESSTSSLYGPRCSAKSMYRLACKVGLDDLRDEAFSYIRNSLTEHNIVKELSCSLVSQHPELLEMELDVLYTHIGSSPVVASFSALAKRIANKELPHGADIIVGIHSRLLDDPHPLQMKLVPAPSTSFGDHWREQEEVEVKASDMLEDGDEGEEETGARVAIAVRPTSPVYPSRSGTPVSIPTSPLVERASASVAKGKLHPGKGKQGMGRPQRLVAAPNPPPPPRPELDERNGTQAQVSQSTIRVGVPSNLRDSFK